MKNEKVSGVGCLEDGVYSGECIQKCRVYLEECIQYLGKCI